MRIILKKIWNVLPLKLKIWLKMNVLFRIESEKKLLVDPDQLSKTFKKCVEHLNHKKPKEFGDYLEFGVFNGTSLSIMYKALKESKIKNVRLFGFDSFEGLPKEARFDDDGEWYEGQFKCSLDITLKNLRKQKVNLDKTHLIKGYFSDTLNQSLIDKYNISKASIIMIDCDMYLSTKGALEFCSPLIQNHCFIVFDDWLGNLAEKNLGEKKAFEEFLQQNKDLKATLFSTYEYKGDNNGRVFFVERTKEI